MQLKSSNDLVMESALATSAFFSDNPLSMEGAVLYPQYYRQSGLRRAVQMVAPTLRPLERLELPKNSLLHYVSDDESLYGIPQEEPILSGETRKIIVDHVTKLRGDKGPPRPMTHPVSSMIRDYFQRNRRMTRNYSLEASLKDQASLMVCNYGMLPHLYRYTQTFFAGYNKWWNIQATLWSVTAEMLAQSERQQFLQVKLPVRLPGLKDLNKAQAGLTRTALAAFTEPSALFILEMWKWFGDRREDSLLGKLTQQQLDRINLVWIESGQWFVMNLGLVNQWRKSDAHPEANINPQQMQRRFLRLLMYLQEARTVASDGEMAPATKDVVIAPTPVPSADPSAPPKVGEVARTEPVKIRVEKTEDSAARTITLKPGMNIDLLPEHPVEETVDNIQAIDDAITRDIEAFDRMNEQMERELGEDDLHLIEDREVPLPSPVEEQVVYRAEPKTLEQSVMDKVDALATKGQVSAPEYRRFLALANAYKKLPDPYGRAESMEAAGKVVYKDALIHKDITVPDQKTVFDKSMLQSSLLDYDPRYIREFLPKDIVRMVLATQKSGTIVAGHQVEEVEDALSHYENHAIQLIPVRGKPSTIHLRIPKVYEDGTFRANGVRYLLRKQRSDKPIRKVNSSTVSLTSYYSKTNVNRSEKQIHNYTGWLTNQIAARGMDPDDNRVTNILQATVYNSYDVVPRIYSILAQRFRSFRLEDIDFFFDYRNREAHFGAERVAEIEKDGLVLMGKQGKNYVAVDKTDTLYSVAGDTITELGKFETIFKPTGKQPMEMTEVKVLNKQLPVGIVLAYLLGLDKLLQVLNLRPRRVPAGERLNLSDEDFALRFEDEALIFPRDNKVASMILSGFNVFENTIRNYPVHLFDKKDIYLNLLEHNRIGVRYLREIDQMEEMFVDPITEMLLEQMGEPTDFIGLLIRSCELLLTDWAPSETDMDFMRSRGYERIAGVIYGELVRSIRQHRAKGQMANSKIEMPPYAVWQTIQQDPAVKLVEESNPIHNLKEKEEITFSGHGGRSGRSMVKRTRVFHQSDMGVISEATKDSGDVAITTFMTADPNLTDLYGNTRRYDPDKDGAASLLSTSALLSPAADRDDPKRVNFISIQQSSSTFAKGYQLSPLRTGYEQIVSHRTDDMFATTARDQGKVVAVSNKAITVEYADGSRHSVELGRRFGTAAGSTFPHEIVTQLKVGDTVRKGDSLSYNSRYFDVDPLNPKTAVLRAGALMTVAIMDSPDTLEDASAISQRAAEMLETEITKPRDIVVKFDQTIHNLVNVGDEVQAEDILCTIEDAVTAHNDLFGEDSKDTMRQIAANNPKAKFAGRVEKIEVFYHGDIEDLSPTLQELAVESDRNRRRLSRELGRKFTSGYVNEGLRVEGQPLSFEHAVIRVYVTGPVAAGVGDKGVFANQLKTVISRVMTGINRTESGAELDACFGGQSISDRIVLNPEIIGTTNALLELGTQQVADAYFGS